jgi:hypothetical protein
MKTIESGRVMQVFVLLITVAGGCLILYSTYRVTTHLDNMNWLVLDLIMFGFGFAAVWFGITHFDIQRTETKIKKIHAKADRIKEILDRK